MAEERQEVHVDGTAPFLNSAAFNTYYTYNPSTKSTFWNLFGTRYKYFSWRYLQDWLYWYDGWVPYFHKAENGIFSTHLAQSLVNRIANKVFGGRLMLKNAGKEKEQSKTLNSSLEKMYEWGKESDVETVFHKATRFSAIAGTCLLKLNKSGSKYWAEALRFDSFVPTVGFDGRVEKVVCYLQQYTAMGEKEPNYYLVEERYFGDYQSANGVWKNRPLVKYSVKRATGVVGSGADVGSLYAESIQFKRLPREVRQEILRSYGALQFDTPFLLPFANDWLGVELVKWTDCISDLPQLPFGESLLSPIISHLMAYDFYFSAFATDMYAGRGKVIVPSYMVDPNKKDGAGGFYNNFNGFVFKQVPTSDPSKSQPFPIQFELRATDWKTIRDTLIENIALNIGVNTSTLAGFLSDNNARTAREVSVDENETAGFINDKRATLEKPFNRFLKRVSRLLGCEDDVVIRWSSAGLTNRQSLAEVLSIGLNAGFISKLKAVEMWNFDDDTSQVAEEYARVKKEEKERQENMFPDPYGSDPRLT